MEPDVFLTIDVEFSAAHRLREDRGPCRGLHGHSYRLRVTVKREEGGGISDLVALQKVVDERIFAPLDHSLLNDQLDDPTAERVARFVWSTIEAVTPSLHEITLAEAADRTVTLRGPA